MHSIEYAHDWADMVIGQLTASHRATSPELWGYACFCISSKFDEFFAIHYYEVDQVVGVHLHVFTLVPPPKNLLDARIKRLRSMDDATCAAALERLQQLRRKWYPIVFGGQKPFSPELIREERAILFSELRAAGVDANVATDFLFFKFRRQSEPGDIDIDVVAAIPAPIRRDSPEEDYFKLFEMMAEKARTAQEQNVSVEEFVASLKWPWSARIALSKTRHLLDLIRSFSAAMHPAK